MTEATTTSPGLQALVGRIRDDAVKSGRDEAERIVAEARAQAAKILAEAKAEAESTIEKARAEIEAHRVASLEALKLAARDTELNLRSKVRASFETFVKRLVTSATRDEELIRAVVLVLAGHAVEEFIKDKEIQILISDVILGGQADERLRERGKQTILELSSDMLREGVELVPASDIQGGARVRLVQDKLEIDLTDEAVARMLYERTLPRFRAIVEGVE
jgi:V/A-type H+/Na+-transporting ATPase subunit E